MAFCEWRLENNPMRNGWWVEEAEGSTDHAHSRLFKGCKAEILFTQHCLDLLFDLYFLVSSSVCLLRKYGSGW